MIPINFFGLEKGQGKPIGFLWIGFLFLVTGCFSPGQRLLNAQVELDGHLILESSFGVSDSLDKFAAFARLEGQPLQETRDWKPVPGSPAVVDFKGKIRVGLIHVTVPFAMVEPTELKIVIDPKSKGTWLIPSSEIKRLGALVK